MTRSINLLGMESVLGLGFAGISFRGALSSEVHGPGSLGVSETLLPSGYPFMSIPQNLLSIQQIRSRGGTIITVKYHNKPPQYMEIHRHYKNETSINDGLNFVKLRHHDIFGPHNYVLVIPLRCHHKKLGAQPSRLGAKRF